MSTSRPYSLRGIPVDEKLEGPIEPYSRILVVDDDEFFNGMIAIALRRVGYHVSTATDGEGAWDVLQSEPFDAMVTDYSMPRLNGLDLLRRVRERQIALPTILMSARMPADVSELLDFVAPGGTLQKPFGLHELYYKVGTILDVARPVDPPASAGAPKDSRSAGRRQRVAIKMAVDLRLTELAEILLVHETLSMDPAGRALAVTRLCGKIREHLLRLWGTVGFCALLKRSLVLACPEVPWLSAVHVSAQGEFVGLPPPGPELPPGERYRGETVLVSKVLDIVVSFLGENVARSCLQEIWHENL